MIQVWTTTGVTQPEEQGTTWSYTDSRTLTDGTYTYKVRIVDTAGNVGINTASQEVTIDTTAPTQIPLITQVSDKNVPATGAAALTNDTTPSISGTLTLALASGETVQIKRTNENTWHNATVSGVSWTYVETTELVYNSTYTYEVRIIDAAGNVDDNTDTQDVKEIRPVGIDAMSGYFVDTTPAISGKGNPGATVTVEITSVADSAMVRDTATTFTAAVTVDSAGDWALTDSDYGTSELAVNLVSSTGTNNLNGYSVTASQDIDSSSANTNFELLALGTVVEGPGTNSYPGAGLNGTDTDGDGYTDDNYVLVSSLTAAEDEYLVMKFADSNGTQQVDSTGAAYALIMKRNPIAMQTYNDTQNPDTGDSYYTAYNDPATNIAQSVNAWYSDYVAPNSAWTDKFAAVTLNGKNRSWNSLSDKAEAGTTYDVTSDTLLSDFLSNPTTGTGDATAFIPSEADLIGTDTNYYPTTTVNFSETNINFLVVNVENGYYSTSLDAPSVAFMYGFTQELCLRTPIYIAPGNDSAASSFSNIASLILYGYIGFDTTGYLMSPGTADETIIPANILGVNPAFWVKIN